MEYAVLTEASTNCASTRFKCVHPRGVAFRQSLHLRDRFFGVRGPKSGDVVECLEVLAANDASKDSLQDCCEDAAEAKFEPDPSRRDQDGTSVQKTKWISINVQDWIDRQHLVDLRIVATQRPPLPLYEGGSSDEDEESIALDGQEEETAAEWYDRWMRGDPGPTEVTRRAQQASKQRWQRRQTPLPRMPALFLSFSVFFFWFLFWLLRTD